MRSLNTVIGLYGLRRPRQTHSMKLQMNSPFWGQHYIQGRYVGTREDTGRIRLPSYLVFDYGLSFEWNHTHQVGLKVLNLFNRQYEEILNFATPGRNVLASYTLWF